MEDVSWLDDLQFEDTEEYSAVELFIAPEEALHRVECFCVSFLETQLLTDCKESLHLSIPARSQRNTHHGHTGLIRLGKDTQKVGLRNPEKVAQIFSLLSFVHRLLREGKHATQRDIFYCLIDSFTTQGVLNACIQDVVGLLGCGRHSLNISTTSRGFIAGNVVWHDAGTSFDLRKVGKHGMAIPGHLTNVFSLQSSAAYVLIVEKDCVFQQLCEARVWEKLDCAVLTGCGFPDFNTRIVAWKLQDRTHPPTVVGVVDYNPSGVAILLTYKLGSQGMGLETFRHVVPVYWLGLHAKDVIGKPSVALTPRDVSVLKKLHAAPLPKEWKEELNKMDKTVEIQAVYNAFRSAENVRALQDKIVTGHYF